MEIKAFYLPHGQFLCGKFKSRDGIVANGSYVMGRGLNITSFQCKNNTSGGPVHTIPSECITVVPRDDVAGTPTKTYLKPGACLTFVIPESTLFGDSNTEAKVYPNYSWLDTNGQRTTNFGSVTVDNIITPFDTKGVGAIVIEVHNPTDHDVLIYDSSQYEADYNLMYSTNGKLMAMRFLAGNQFYLRVGPTTTPSVLIGQELGRRIFSMTSKNQISVVNLSPDIELDEAKIEQLTRIVEETNITNLISI